MLSQRGILLALAVGLAASSVALTATAQQPAPAPPKPAPKLVAPKLVTAPEIAYPEGGKGDAVVILTLVLDDQGNVENATVEEGEEPFATAAAQGAKAFKFSPATRDGTPIKAKIRYSVSFTAPKPVVETPPTEAPPGETAKPKPELPPAPKEEPLEVSVVGDKPAPSVTTFSRAEVRELPGAFGDPFRAIESMPGVTPIVSGLPFFYVRGAPPGNVGYFLDGIRVPYLYHVGLGPSVVHPGMVDRVDLYPGGYPARFGRYAGGIVSGEVTQPRADTHGEGNIRVFDAGALVETGFDGGRGTVLLGGRYSYTAAVLSLIAKDTILDYRDYQARITYDLTPKDRISLFGFGAYDLLARKQLGETAVIFGSEFYRGDLRWDHSFSTTTTARAAFTLGFDQTKLGETRNARDTMMAGRLELRSVVSKKVMLRAGMDATTDKYTATRPLYADPDSPDVQRAESLFPSRVDFAGGVWTDVLLTPNSFVEITPGVRADLFKQGDATKVAVDPRISARFKINDWLKIVHAYGIAHQAPSFVVPVPGLQPASLANGLQSAWQASAGVELAMPLEINTTMSVFYNAFFDMTDGLGTAADSLESAQFDKRSRGRAIGFEFFAKRKLSKRLGGFLSYTLSRSTRDINGRTFVATFDRTHVASAALAYDLGRNWRAGGRFTFYTGGPIVSQGRGLNPVPPTLSPDRDPAFYRLDVRLEKRWNFGSSTWLSVVAEMLNATLHKETISGQEIGPVSIPSIGLEGAF
ncbi:MAG: TonB-dependent receptor plug domain-containing protein [Polyangiales bacterium]